MSHTMEVREQSVYTDRKLGTYRLLLRPGWHYRIASERKATEHRKRRHGRERSFIESAEFVGVEQRPDTVLVFRLPNDHVRHILATEIVDIQLASEGLGNTASRDELLERFREQRSERHRTDD